MNERLSVPVTSSMVRLPVRSDRVELAEDASAPGRPDLDELGDLLGARGADAAWALIDDADGTIASWVALTVVPLDGTTPGAVRHATRHDQAFESEESFHETALGRAMRLRQRAPIAMPTADDPDGLIVCESLDWSWVLPNEKMVFVNSNTTRLDHVEWVARHVDLVAAGIDVVG